MTFSAMKFSMGGDEATPRPFNVTSFTVRLTAATGLRVTLGTCEAVSSLEDLVVSWGDGTTTTYEPSHHDGRDWYEGVYHQYSAYGTYTITLSDAIYALHLAPDTAADSSSIWGSITTGATDPFARLLSVAPHIKEFSDGGCAGLRRLDVLPGSLDYMKYGAASGVDVGYACFRGCSGLTTLEGLAKFVKSVDQECFAGCSSLVSLAGASAFLPSSAGCFRRCTKLTSLAGMGSVASFGAEMFEGCSRLPSLAGIPATVATLGAGCFARCTSLSSLSALANTAVVDLPARCFYGCSSVTGIDEFKNKFHKYGDECFVGTGLTRLFDPYNFTTESTTEFGARCFMGTPIRSVNMSGTNDSPFTKIGDECFRDCTYLTLSGGFGWNVTTMGEGVFRGCYAREVNEQGRVVSERGLTNIRIMQTLHLLSAVPSYTFYGDALVSSLAGLDEHPASGSRAKTRLGHYCFAGCNSLASLDGLQPMSVDAEEDAVTQPRYPDILLGEGVFSDLYCPPYELESDPVVNGQRKKRYRGVVDVSALTLMPQVGILPASTFEGCSLIPDFPPVTSYLWWFGDRCFARCRNMRTLDSLASVVPDPDAVSVAGAMVRVRLPRFGAYCFADCTWKGIDDKPSDDSDKAIYEPDPSSPPQINSGLTHIGGMRVLVDKLVFTALCEIADGLPLPEYLPRRWAGYVNLELGPAMLDGLDQEHGTDYDWRSGLAAMMSYGLQSGGISPTLGMTWAVLDGVQYAEDVTFTNGSASVALTARRLVDESGLTIGATLDVGWFYATASGSARSTSVPNIQLRFTDAGTERAVAELDNGFTLYASGILTGGSFVKVDGAGEELSIGIHFRVCQDQGTSGEVPVGTVDFEDEIDIGSFSELVPEDAYSTMTFGWLLYMAFAYAAHMPSWVANRFGGVSGLVDAMEVAASADGLGMVFQRALCGVALTGMDRVLGEHCFEGCATLSVNAPSAGAAVSIDGFSSAISAVPNYCFRNSGVTPNSEFRYVQRFGRYSFAGTPTEDLSGLPPGMDSIAEGVFSGCEDFTQFGLVRNGLVSLGPNAFANCGALADLRAQGMNCADLDGSSSLSLLASMQYTEFVDKYGYSSLVATLGSQAFARTGITSLVIPWDTISYGNDEGQDLVSDLFGSDGPFTIVVDTVGRVDNGTTSKEFLLRLQTGGWRSKEIVFKGYANIGNVNAAGFDMQGEAVADGCVGSISFTGTITGSYYWDEPYSRSQPADAVRRCAPYASDSTDFVDFQEKKVRVSCPAIWFSGRSGSSVPQCAGDVLYLMVGPYKVGVQVCLSAAVTKDGGGTVTNIDYSLRGVKCVSISRIAKSTGLDKVPLFPLLSSVGAGCFEGCTSLEGVDGLEGLYSYPARCFAGCPFLHDVSDPEVVAPVVTATMPVRDTRLQWQRNVLSAVYLYRSSSRSGGLVQSIRVSTSYDSAAGAVVLSVTHGQDGRTYTVDSDTIPSVTYQGETFTPRFVSVDDTGLVLSFNGDLEVKVPFEWESDGSYVYFDYAEVYSDLVEDEMTSYFNGIALGSVVDGSAEGHDFIYEVPGMLDLEGNDRSSVISLSWARDTGVWGRVVQGSDITPGPHSGSPAGLVYRSVTVFDPGSVTFLCVAHEEDEWTVVLSIETVPVVVVARSVVVPATINDIGNDCFSFDGYPDVAPLQAVYFVGRDASSVQNMSGYPFGVPPGCQIIVGDSVVYTEPLPSP